jgi:hypothetical protein
MAVTAMIKVIEYIYFYRNFGASSIFFFDSGFRCLLESVSQQHVVPRVMSKDERISYVPCLFYC